MDRPIDEAKTPLTICQQLTLRPISELRPHPRNARRHSRGQILALAKVIGEVGFIVPVLVDAASTILAGHARVETAKHLGLTQVPVILVDHLTDAQARAFMLADNKLTDRSDWDDVKLAVQLKELAEIAVDFDIEVTGFERPEIDFRIQSLEGIDSIGQSDDFQFASGPSISTPGDVWQLGDHRVLCGSALDDAVASKLFAGEKASAAFSDPPYNVKIDGHVGGKGSVHHRDFPMATGEMSEVEFRDFLTSGLSVICQNTVPGSLIYTCMDWRHMSEMLAAGRASNCDLLNLCVWVKSNGGMGSLYRSRHELVFVFRNGSEAHMNNIQLGRFGRNRTNVWNYAGGNSFARKGSKRNLELHPTVKPLLLVADAIQDSTNTGNIVFDPFLGSGTTLLAAERIGRRCYGVELDPLYVDTTVDRWQRMTGRKAHNALGESFDFLKSRRTAANG